MAGSPWSRDCGNRFATRARFGREKSRVRGKRKREDGGMGGFRCGFSQAVGNPPRSQASSRGGDGFRSRRGVGLPPIVDLDRLVACLEFRDLEAFRQRYEEAVAERIQTDSLAREAWWTDSIAVGSRSFVENAQAICTHRRQFDVSELNHGASQAWSLRESKASYG